MSIEPIIRMARPEDGEAISSLYRNAYAAADSGTPDKLYPFPQFMHPSWVRKASADRTVCWMVAEVEREVVGSFGALVNVGSDEDRVAELFGLVIRKDSRMRGMGTRLFAGLMENLSDASFILAETRTAMQGGWRIVRNHGFVLCGFEPFAHKTPAGSEPMLLLGHLSEACKAQRSFQGCMSPAAAELAGQVLSGACLSAPGSEQATGYPINMRDWSTFKDRLAAVESASSLALELPGDNIGFELIDDELMARRVEAEWNDDGFDLSGVIGLGRLEGQESEDSRYTKKCLVTYMGGQMVSYVRVVWDHIDHRARIIRLSTIVQGLQGLVISAVVDWLKTAAGSDPLSVVIDVRADKPRLHATLEDLGFFPTVYYPAFIASSSGRVDAVQYTRLNNRNFDDNAKWVSGLTWGLARSLSETVTRLANR